MAQQKRNLLALLPERDNFESLFLETKAPDEYGVFTPRKVEWTLNGRPLASLSVIDRATKPETGPGDPPCGFRGNAYVVFPVPANVKRDLR